MAIPAMKNIKLDLPRLSVHIMVINNGATIQINIFNINHSTTAFLRVGRKVKNVAVRRKSNQ